MFRRVRLAASTHQQQHVVPGSTSPYKNKRACGGDVRPPTSRETAGSIPLCLCLLVYYCC